MISQDTAELVYDRLEQPAVELGRWLLRRRSGVSNAQLRTTAYRMLAYFEELADAPLPELEVTVSTAPEGGAAEPIDETSTADVLLEETRRVRDLLTSGAGESISDAVRLRMPELHARYSEAQDSALSKLDEIEAVLVLFGAGTDEDAHLAEDLIPLAEDAEPGPSVPFQH